MRTHESKSSIEVSRCPLRYMAKYGEGLEEETGNPALIGKAVHSACEKALNRAVLTGVYELSEVEVLEELAQLGTFEPEPYLLKALTANFSSIKDKLYDDHDQEIDLKADYGARAIIDVLSINGEVAQVIDYKTSRGLSAEYELKSESNWQTLTNCAVVFENYPEINVVNLIYWFIRFGKKGFIPITTTRAEYNILKPFLISAVDRCRKILSGEIRPEPKPGSYCRYCGLKEECLKAENTDVIADSIKANTADISRKAKARLKKIAEEQAPPVIGGQELWKIVEKEKITIPPYNMGYAVDAIRNNGLELGDYVSIPESKIKKLLTSIEEIKSLIVEKTTTSFELIPINIDAVDLIEKTAVDTFVEPLINQPIENTGDYKPVVCSFCDKPQTKHDAELLNPEAKRHHTCDCLEPATGKKIHKLIEKTSGEKAEEWITQSFNCLPTEVTIKQVKEELKRQFESFKA